MTVTPAVLRRPSIPVPAGWWLLRSPTEPIQAQPENDYQHLHHITEPILCRTAVPAVLLLFALPQAGGCYVPLDPTFPADRLSIYLEDSESVAVITQHSNMELAASLIADLPTRPEVSLAAANCY